MADEVFDLDIAAKEAGIEPREMHFAGRTWLMPATVPLRALSLLSEGEFEDSMRFLLGDNAEEIMAAGFGLDHLNLVLEKLYGLAEGEAGASSPSLNRAGRRARQT